MAKKAKPGAPAAAAAAQAAAAPALPVDGASEREKSPSAASATQQVKSPGPASRSQSPVSAAAAIALLAHKTGADPMGGMATQPRSPMVPAVPLYMRAPPEADVVLEAVESQLLAIEHSILECHSTALTRWTDEQRRALQRAADLDREALESQRTVSEACLDGLYADIDDHRAAREAALHQAHDSTEACDEAFARQLQQLGDTYAAQAAEAVGRSTAAIAANGDAFLDAEWAQFDVSLRTILWQHAKLIRGTSLVEGIAELYEQGDLHPHLDAEKQGWGESQSRDLQLLRAEVEREHKGVFATLDAKLKELLPSVALSKPRTQQLTALMAANQQRLAEVEAEVRSAYEAEIAAALVQCEEDYRGYDVELQRIQLRTLQRRFADAAHMRQLKLALCRWRLDYQKVYHEHYYNMLTAAAAPPPPRGKAKQVARELESTRSLVVDLWARNRTPNSEIRRFLDKVLEAAARAGRAEPVAQLYQGELAELGALPILEHAERPELLECWMQSLRDGNMPPEASKRPSIGTSGGERAQ